MRIAAAVAIGLLVGLALADLVGFTSLVQGWITLAAAIILVVERLSPLIRSTPHAHD
jgi:hypothetical protein